MGCVKAAAEFSFEIIDTEARQVWTPQPNQQSREVGHEERKVGRVMNGTLFDIHKIFESPKLFGIAKVELNLKA